MITKALPIPVVTSFFLYLGHQALSLPFILAARAANLIRPYGCAFPAQPDESNRMADRQAESNRLFLCFPLQIVIIKQTDFMRRKSDCK